AGLFDRRRDGRVIVAERGAHLPRIEVEPALAGDVLDLRALPGHEDRPGNLSLVHAGAEAVAPGAGEQVGFVFHGMSPVGSAGDTLSTTAGTDVRGRRPRELGSDQRDGRSTVTGPGFCAIGP